ncbi:MAG: Rqc2 family fibronectin-binding protein [Nitrospiraceae bacterium]
MSLSATEIGAVVTEVAPLLAGGWIQKIFQPTPQVLILEIRALGKTRCFLISIHPETARIHLVTQRLPNPVMPPAFCQFLRAHVQGARIDAVEQVPNDRIVRIALSAREGLCSLVAELTGKKADVLLLSGTTVVATLNNQRERIGRSYEAPRLRAAQDNTSQSKPPAHLQDGGSVSAWVETQYGKREEELAIDHLRHVRLTAVRKNLKKGLRRVEALRADIEKAVQYRDYARYGELLKANLGQMHKGQERISAVDYFDERLPELMIPLDSTKSPHGNMDDYFKKHRKYLMADRKTRPRLEAAEQEVQVLRKELTDLEQPTWRPTADNSMRQPELYHPRKVAMRAAKTAGNERRGPFRRFTSTDGLPIYVGRNARENEELTFAFAKSEDLWLHARGTPGSHVVVRLEKGADPPLETVKDAATLALLYSDLRKSGKGDVIFTRRKWVRKLKGQPPGTVAVTQEKSLFVNLDKARLEALKQRMPESSLG